MTYIRNPSLDKTTIWLCFRVCDKNLNFPTSFFNVTKHDRNKGELDLLSSWIDIGPTCFLRKSDHSFTQQIQSIDFSKTCPNFSSLIRVTFKFVLQKKVVWNIHIWNAEDIFWLIQIDLCSEQIEKWKTNVVYFWSIKSRNKKQSFKRKLV